MELEQRWLLTLQVVFTALVAVSAGVLILTRTFRKRTPPGPTPWPVVGNMYHLGTLPHQTLAKYAKQYGPLMSLWFGSKLTLVASSPKMAEEFLKNNDLIWASRPLTTAGKLLCYDAKDIGCQPYGPRWRYARKVFTTELFTAKRLADFQKTRKEEIANAVNSMIDDCSSGTKPVRIDVVLGKMTLNNLTRMLMNEGLLSDEASAIKSKADFQQVIKEAFVLAGLFYLGDYIPWLDPFDPQGLKKRMRAIAKRYDEFIESILEDHRQKHKMQKEQGTFGSVDTVQDIVDVLLTRPTDVDGQRFSEDEMKGLMENVLIAGTDTSSSTIEWGLTELLKNPHTLKRAQAEMDSVVGRNRLVQESDLPNLPYLNAVLKEVFRLHPVAPLMGFHESTEDCEIAGYQIPARSRVLVNVYAIQRDPEVWDRALEFHPERFLDSKKDIHGKDFDLLPFGTGRRICPGKGLGILMVHYALAVLIQTCDWTLPGDMKPEDLDVDEIFGLNVPRLNPLQAIVVPRVPKSALSI